MRYLIFAFCFLIFSCQKSNTSDDNQPDEAMPGKWERMADMPEAMTETSVTQMGGKLYISGGYINSAPTDKVYEYDPQNDSWTSLSVNDLYREHFSCATSGNLVYLLGGRKWTNIADGLETYKNFSVFSAVDETITELEDVPENISASCLASLNGCVYTFGGESAIRYSYFLVKNAYEYNISLNEWRELNDIPISVHRTNAVTIGNSIYIAGGGNQSGSCNFSNHTYKFTISD